MIEVYESLFRAAVFLVCMIAVIWSGVRAPGRDKMVLGFLYLSFLLGDLFWAVYYYFYNAFSYVAYLGWYVGYYLLYVLLRQEDDAPSWTRRSFLVWIPPILCLASWLHFFRFGEYLDNFVSELLLGLIGYAAASMLLRGTKKRALCRGALVFVTVEHLAWFAGEL